MKKVGVLAPGPEFFQTWAAQFKLIKRNRRMAQSKDVIWVYVGETADLRGHTLNELTLLPRFTDNPRWSEIIASTVGHMEL